MKLTSNKVDCKLARGEGISPMILEFDFNSDNKVWKSVVQSRLKEFFFKKKKFLQCKKKRERRKVPIGTRFSKEVNN